MPGRIHWDVSWGTHHDLELSGVLKVAWECLHGHNLVVPTPLPSILASPVPEQLP